MFKKFFVNFDLVLLMTTVVLYVVGVFFIYSSAIDSFGVLTNNEYIKQLFWGLFALSLLAFFTLTDYRIWETLAYVLYVLGILLLLLTLFFGREVNGARAWLGWGGLGVQPSEFMKLFTIILLARYFTRHRESLAKTRYFFFSLLIVLPPFLLTLLQPDMGTALVYLFFYWVMAFIMGINAYILIFLSLVAIFGSSFLVYGLWQLSLPSSSVSALGSLFIDSHYFFISLLVLVGFTLIFFIGFMFFKQRLYFFAGYVMASLVIGSLFYMLAQRFLKPYQIKRIIIFLDPSLDPQGAGWNIRQALIAIGSGGFSGQGFLQGSQSHNQYVPAQSTDFIFSILAEEWGFQGALLILVLFLLMCWRFYVQLNSTQNIFAQALVSGLWALFIVHWAVNLAMVLGLAPIVGIPLLLLSYGGSSLILAFSAIGIVLSISLRS